MQIVAAIQGQVIDIAALLYQLASQLMAAGDHDLARALVLSVASSADGNIKARAVQLLGQIR